jgi:antitoxin (DNA-binding transcriptional repressor) of toxin-antitoxin stability system
MKTVSAHTLKSRMAELFRELEATGEELLVVDKGQTVMKIISYRREFGERKPNGNKHGAAS